MVASLILQISREPASAQTEPPDYDIPNGHFYSQAHPAGTRGEGYAVTNSLAIPLWDAYLKEGGWQVLGYPLSRRYIASGHITQSFQFGTLVWNELTDVAERVNPRPASEIPDAPRVPEPAHRAMGQSAHQPWSGWWWSVSGVGPALDAVGGPLWKYDRAVEAVKGVNPATREWESRELSPVGLGLLWAGHCNGWAAASVIEEEPQAPREVAGTTFTVGDQKGLLSDLHFGDSASWAYGGNDDLNAADFHRMLLSWVGEQRKAMIVTFRLGDDEVWSYPAYRFELHYGPDADDPEWSVVEARAWLVDNDVSLDFVGSRPWPSDDGKKFHYRIKGLAQDPTDGMWTGISADGRFAHPFQIWYPDPSQRNLGRQLIAPGLDESMIREITSIRLPTATPTITPSPTPTATSTETPTPAPTPSPTDQAMPTPSLTPGPTRTGR